MPRASHWIEDGTTEVEQCERIIAILRSTKVLDRTQNWQEGVPGLSKFEAGSLAKGNSGLRALRRLPNENGGYGLPGLQEGVAAPTWVLMYAPYNQTGDQVYKVEGDLPRIAVGARKAVYHFFHSDKPFAAT